MLAAGIASALLLSFLTMGFLSAGWPFSFFLVVDTGSKEHKRRECGAYYCLVHIIMFSQNKQMVCALGLEGRRPRCKHIRFLCRVREAGSLTDGRIFRRAEILEWAWILIECVEGDGLAHRGKFQVRASVQVDQCLFYHRLSAPCGVPYSSSW